MGQVKEQLPHKATKEELADLEARMMQRLQEMFDQLRQMFPDKEALKKKLAAMEKNIKSLYEMIVANQNKAPQEESAMFTKKYVGPVNCASCEKDIVNLLAQPVDYHVWKRLPFREPSERIARYGQGFSKILTMMKPSESTQVMQAEHSRNDIHRNFNNTQ